MVCCPFLEHSWELGIKPGSAKYKASAFPVYYHFDPQMTDQVYRMSTLFTSQIALPH